MSPTRTWEPSSGCIPTSKTPLPTSASVRCLSKRSLVPIAVLSRALGGIFSILLGKDRRRLTVNHLYQHSAIVLFALCLALVSPLVVPILAAAEQLDTA